MGFEAGNLGCYRTEDKTPSLAQWPMKVAKEVCRKKYLKNSIYRKVVIVIITENFERENYVFAVGPFDMIADEYILLMTILK